MKTIIYNIYNAVKRTLNRFSPFVITRLLKAHNEEIKALNELFANFAKNNKPTTNKLQKEIKALKSANDALRDSLNNTSKLIEKDINALIKKHKLTNYLDEVVTRATSEIEELKEINKLSAKRHKRLYAKFVDLEKKVDNLKDYQNEFDKEDYSYQYELEQKNDALIEALRQQGISDNVINNIIDTLLLKLKLNDEGGK